MPDPDDRSLALTGLNGGNVLGFLASVGTLRTLALADPTADWRMKWIVGDGSWIPAISSQTALSPDTLAERLFALLGRAATLEFEFAKSLSVTPGAFVQVAREAQQRASRHDRCFADFLVSFGSEAFSTRDGKILDTGLRTMSGAGNQHFLDTMKKLLDKTTGDDLRRSLFDPWDYADRKLGLRWDPEEDRRYALRWGNPSDGKGVPTMHGANRLAVEALPLLPTAPGATQLHTTGIARRDRGVFLTWPIWEDPLSMDVVRSLLALRELQDPEPNRAVLRAMGIAEVYRCQRITTGKFFRNFTHAVPA